MSLFRGRTEVYARRWEKDGRSGYSPAYDFNWDEFMAHKRRGGSMKDFENKKLISLTKEVVKNIFLEAMSLGFIRYCQKIHHILLPLILMVRTGWPIASRLSWPAPMLA